MITTEDRFNRPLSAHKDGYNVSKLKTERAERVDLLDKFAGTEGFEEQIAMLEDDIARIDAVLPSNARSEPTVEAASPPERVGSTDGLCHTGDK